MKKKHGGKLPMPPRRNVGATPLGRPATAVGPNEFSPRQETSMRKQAQQARLAPLPSDNDADDMGGM